MLCSGGRDRSAHEVFEMGLVELDNVTRYSWLCKHCGLLHQPWPISQRSFSLPPHIDSAAVHQIFLLQLPFVSWLFQLHPLLLT